MQTRTLGPLQVSTIGLGCNNFGRQGFVTEGIDGTRAVLDACLDHGVTLLDTAAIYGGPESMSERLMGEALQGRRDRVVLATKFGHSAGPEPAEWGARGSKGFIRRACEASLTRLRTDHIDLYQMHVPDPSTPIAETLEALAGLQEEGKIVAYGHSNFSAEQIREAAQVASDMGVAPFVAGQNHYSLLAREIEADVLPAIEACEIALLPYFPLANGLLTGKYRKGEDAPGDSRLAQARQRFESVTDAQWDAIEAFRALTDELGVSMLQATFAWLLSHDAVPSVIAGATRPDQVAQNAAAADVVLSDDAIARITEIFTLS